MTSTARWEAIQHNLTEMKKQGATPDQLRQYIDEIGGNEDIKADPQKASWVYNLAADIRGGFERGAATLAGTPQAFVEGVKGGAGLGMGLPPQVRQAIPNPLPSAQSLTQAAGRIDPAAVKTPTGPHGRFASNLYELFGAGGGFAPGASLTGAAVGAVPGEVARVIAPEYEGIARAGGNIAGALGYAPAYRKAAVAKQLRTATEGVTPRQWRKAALLEAESRRQGIPLMGHEAIAPTSSHPMATLGGYVASSRGGTRVANRLAARPAQIGRAVGAKMRGASPSEPTEPQMIARKAAEAARGRIDRATGARTKATSKYFRAAAKENIGEDDARNIVKAIDERLSNISPKSPAHKELTDIKDLLLNKDGSVNTRVGPLHSHLKYLRDTKFKANPANPDAISKEQASQIKPVLEMLRSSFEKTSKNFRAGQSKYKALSEKLVKPLLEGPVSKMEKAGGKEIQTVGSIGDETISKAVRAMTSTKEIGPKGIKILAHNMNKQDRAAFPRLARYYLETAFNDATGRIQGAATNPLGGVNWIKTVYGNKDIAANTQAVLRGVAQAHGVEPVAYMRGWRNLFRVIDASGRTPHIGSATHSRADIAKGLGSTKLSEGRDLLVKMKFDLLPWRTRQLARVLTAKDSVSKIRALANLNPRSKKARALVTGLLAPVLADSEK